MTSYPSQLTPGTVLGAKYQIGPMLGSGTMGTVFAAVQLDLRRHVAVKVLRPEHARDPALLERFRREALAAAALGHPNIVQVTDFQHPPGEPPFLVMEKLDGHSLGAILAREPRLAPERVAAIALQVLSALSAAHRAGIVHRDVKPDNVFLVRTPLVVEFVKVLDFGVAKITEGPLSAAAPSTAEGRLVGTLSYMAPEQAASRPLDGRADIYAVGAVMYTALAGRRVFDVLTVPAMLAAIATQPHVPLGQLVPAIDPRFAALIDRALAKDPAARFATADEMAATLSPFARALGASPLAVSGFAPPGVAAAAMLAAGAPPTAGIATASATGIARPSHVSNAPPPAPISRPPAYGASSPPPDAISGTLVSPGNMQRGASMPPSYAPPRPPAAGSNALLWVLLGVGGVFGLAAAAGAAVLLTRTNGDGVQPRGSASASASASATAGASALASAPSSAASTAPHSITPGRDAGAHVAVDASTPPLPPPARVPVSLGGQSNQDYYDPVWLQHTAAPRQGAIEACYGAQPTIAAWDKEACWDLHFDAQGNVYTVDQLSARISPPLEKCVANALTGIKLGPPPKKPGPGNAGICVTVK